MTNMQAEFGIGVYDGRGNYRPAVEDWPCVYISGPISADTPRGELHNVEIADEVFGALCRGRFAVHCPHWSYHSKWNHSANGRMTLEDWMKNDLPLIARYDALLRLPGASKGADIECEHARKLGIPIYVDRADLFRDRDKIPRRRPAVAESGQIASGAIVPESSTPVPEKGILWRGNHEPNGNLPAFGQILNELNEMQLRKGRDYGTKEDPLANLRASEAFGVPAWQGAVIRGNDKMRRLQTFIRRGTLVNESAEDAMLDLAVYAIHALRLFREATHASPRESTKNST